MANQDDIVRGERDYPNAPALLFEGRTWSYGDLDSLTDSMAANLMAQGLRTGDRVALLFANGPEIVLGYYACFKAGLVAVPLNTRMKAQELAYVLNHSGARVLLGKESLFRTLVPVRDDLTALEKCFISDAEAGDEQPLDALLAPAQNQELPAVATDATALLVYTSGSTALPKGVAQSLTTLDIRATSRH